MTKGELKDFNRKLDYILKGPKDADNIVTLADTLDGLSWELDHLLDDFLGIKGRNLSDREVGAIYDKGSSIKEFRKWLKKKIGPKRAKK